MFRMKIKPRSTREPTGQQPVPMKKIAKKKARTSPRGKMIGDGSRVQIKKMGPPSKAQSPRTIVQCSTIRSPKIEILKARVPCSKCEVHRPEFHDPIPKSPAESPKCKVRRPESKV